MAKENNLPEESGEIKRPSGGSLSGEGRVEIFQEGEKKIEREPSPEEIITKEALKREIDKMELDDSLKEEVAEKVKKIQVLGEEEKIEHLLEITKQKGIVFAVRVAKQMNDPYILDIFHDILVKEWLIYKQFLK